jgi:hypothetical protein
LPPAGRPRRRKLLSRWTSASNRALDLVVDLACASRALTVTALGLVVAGIGFAGAVVYVAVSTMGAIP